MKKQRSIVSSFLALAMAASLCVSPVAGAQSGVGVTETRTVTASFPGIPTSRQDSLSLQDIVGVYAGTSKICAVTTTGGVKCWGAWINYMSSQGSRIPVDVAGLSSGVKSLAGGDDHMCALATSGGVKCWGWNGYGQLGNGTNTDSNSLVDVIGLSNGVTFLASGMYYACAVTNGGGVKCWGDNFKGQLGDGTTVESNRPVNVVGLSSGVVALGAGVWHTCAVTSSGGVKCWGWNGEGELGDGTTTDHWSPVDVVGINNAVSVAVNWSGSCALTSAGGVKCWGGSYGKTPVDVPGLTSGVMGLVMGDHTCALTNGGGVKCWGSNGSGELGDGTTTDRATPVDVAGLGGSATMAAAGRKFSCAVVGGGVKCWGANGKGQLGTGETFQRLLPRDVHGPASGLSAVSAGTLHTCALTNTGSVKCWGDNSFGGLGDGTNNVRSLPVDACSGGADGCTTLLSSVTALSAGQSRTCALTTAGEVKCWGNWAGDGTTMSHNLPVSVCAGGPAGCATPLSGVTTVSAGLTHTCAVAGGGVKCWGKNDNGQLGDGSTVLRLRPVDVVGLTSGAVGVTAGGIMEDILEVSHTCALTLAGGVKCWGVNWSGQLGNGGYINSKTPVDVVGLSSGVMAVSAGGKHTCALTTSGGVKCWGWNPYGQLGNGSFMGSNTPVDVCAGGAAGCTATLSNIIAISAGEDRTCALTDSGAVKCWGAAATLGAGVTTNQPKPVDVTGLGGGVTMLEAGGGHTCVLVGEGRAKCWGADVYGQIGLGLGPIQLTPANVVASVAPSLLLNYSAGKPGSFYTLTGFDFPANASLSFTVNDVALPTTATTDASGGFIFFLDTAAADAGLYTITANAGSTAVASFVLSPNAPLRVQEGGGTTFAVPGGIAQPAIPIYLPLMQR